MEPEFENDPVIQLADRIARLSRRDIIDILVDTPSWQILSLCERFPQYRLLCDDVNIWAGKLGVSVEEFRNTGVTPFYRYLEILRGRCSDIINCLNLAGSLGDRVVIEDFLNNFTVSQEVLRPYRERFGNNFNQGLVSKIIGYGY